MRCLSSEHAEGWHEASAVGLLVVFAGELLAEVESRSLENFRVQAPSFTNHVLDWTSGPGPRSRAIQRGHALQK
jgi:hypothetical protein